MQHQNLETPEPTPPYAAPKLEKLDMTHTESNLVTVTPDGSSTFGSNAS